MRVSLLFFLAIFNLCSTSMANKEHILQHENLLDDFGLLTTDLLYRTKARHCYTIITDSIYRQLLDQKLFKEIESASYIVVLVSDSEDMLTPSSAIVEPLLEARRVGCETYLVYLANGIQAERFLRYADQNRMVKTRSRVIMLHDYRLFAVRLHYIWRRIVNVLFVRRYEDNGKHDNETTYSQAAIWFELSTVPFPLPIRQVFVSKQLDFWRMGRYRRGGKLFADKTKNLKGELMNVVVLRHTPAVAAHLENNQTIYTGLEVEIMMGIARAMNFTVELYETLDAATEKWGHVLENGSVTGLLSDMINGEADFALGDLYYTPYHLDKMDLSIPYSTQCLTFFTPEALTDNSWQTLILPFSTEMWVAVLFFLLCVGIVFYVLGQIHLRLRRKESEALEIAPGIKLDRRRFKIVKIKKAARKGQLKESVSMRIKIIPKKQTIGTVQMDIFDTFGNCILLTYSMLLVVSLPRLPRSWSIRVLTGWYWIYCILVVVAYRASLTAILANPAPRLTIDTLKQLAESPIACGAWGDQTKQFFLTSLDETSQRIGAKIEETENAAEAIERVVAGKFAYYENEYFLKEMRARRGGQSDADLETLHIMSECAIHMPISLGLEKNSPMKPRVDMLLRRIIESGLSGKWLSDAKRRYECSVETDPKEALVELNKLYGALVALVIGYGVSTLALLVERLYWHFVVLKSPQYDKFAIKS